MIDPNAIGGRIRRTREACHLTQHRMALLIGDAVTQSVVSRWEGGNAVPKTEHLAAVAQTLGCSVDFLLFGMPEIPKMEDVAPQERRRAHMY